MKSTLFFVIPCFNEEACIMQTAEQVLAKCDALNVEGKIASESAVFFIDDGSTDNTWNLIKELSEKTEYVHGISLAQNYGHQTALYAGLLESKDKCDIAISLDADGQHDLAAVDKMLEAYAEGNDIVCAVRKSGDYESLFKRVASDLYYYIFKVLGINLIRGHADYRLVTAKAISALESTPKKVLFLRGDFLKLSLPYTSIEYSCKKRLAGKPAYSPRKRVRLALNGLASNGILAGFAKDNLQFEIAEKV